MLDQGGIVVGAEVGRLLADVIKVETAAYADAARVLSSRGACSARWRVTIARISDGLPRLVQVQGADVEGFAFMRDGQVEPVGAHGRIVRHAEADQLWRWEAA